MSYLKSMQSLVEERTLHLIKSAPSYWIKSDGTPVSSVDLSVQEELIKILEDRYPNHRILYEEGESKHCFKSSEFTWIIDPIDGTANFLEGKREYSIAIGLMKGNEFLESLVIFPAYGESFYAAKGEGVYLNNKKMKVSKSNPKEKEIVFCSRTYENARNRMKNYDVTFYRCATYSIRQVLIGKALAFYAANTMLYDVGPISHIASEAGIECFSGIDQVMMYHADLERIPMFLAVSEVASRQLRQLILTESKA